ncbi:MAG: 7-carboxy-7-deazaguanine synthase QueE [Waterburya sp.]
MKETLPVIEIFGPTIQGEGALIGAQTMFIRLGNCDYRCSWCDSLHAVLPEEVAKNAVHMTFGEIISVIQGLEPTNNLTPWITLSGGNPAIHKNFLPLIDLLRAGGYKVALETQGSIWNDWVMECNLVTVSPKPPSSKMVTDYKLLDRFARSLQSTNKMNMKVVVFDEEDLNYAKEISKRYPEFPLYLSVGNEVGSSGVDDLLDKLGWLVEKCKSIDSLKRAIILPQLHVLLWGNSKGV